MDSPKRRRSTPSNQPHQPKAELWIGRFGFTLGLILTILAMLSVVQAMVFLWTWIPRTLSTNGKERVAEGPPECIIYQNIEYCAETCVDEDSSWNTYKWAQKPEWMQSCEELYSTYADAPTAIRYQDTEYSVSDMQYQQLVSFQLLKTDIGDLVRREQPKPGDERKRLWRADDWDRQVYDASPRQASG